MAIAFFAVPAYAGDAQPDEFNNVMIGPNIPGRMSGDMDSYDHEDRNLIMNMKGRGDGGAIRSGFVRAHNVTINADFPGDEWNNKGITGMDKVDDGSKLPPAQIIADGDIVIHAGDHGAYTQVNGEIIIEGFKKLEITSTSKYGVVDNGDGITIKGGEDSIVEITSKDTSKKRIAIGNTEHSLESKGAMGTKVSIEAGKEIKLTAPEISAFAGPGYNKFKIDLDAPTVDLTGSVVSKGGDITINAKEPGTVTVKPGTKVDAPILKEDLSTTAIAAGKGGQITVNMGDNSQILGDATVSDEGSTLTLNAAGSNFSMSRSDTAGTGNLVTAKDSGVANITATGAGSRITGNMQTSGDGKIQLKVAGSGSALTGDLFNVEAAGDDASQPSSGTLTADFDQASVWTGSLTNNAGTAAISLQNGSSWNGDLKALAEAGGTVVDLKGGSTWTGKAEGNGDISLAASRWNLTADSTAGSVNPDAGSVVSLEGGASKLTTEKLGGSGGHFLMDLVYGGDTVEGYRDGTGSDFIIARGGNGSTYTVDLTADSSVNSMKSGSKLFFASTAPSTSTFEVGQGIQIQNYRKIYNKNLVVQKETDGTSSDYAGYDDWFLTPADIKDPGGNVVTPPAEPGGYTINPNGMVPGAAHNAAAAIWRDNDTLLKRLGELRWSRNDDGVWGRYINRKVSLDGALGFDTYMNTLQLGYDRKLSASFGDFFLGGAIEHSRGTEKYDDGDGSVYMTDGALYGTFIGKSGDYVDLVAKAGKIFTHYSSDYGDGGDFENWGFSASAEYGHKFDLGWSMSLEPQVQLRYSYLWADDYTSDNGAKVYQDDVDSLVGRFGFVLAKEFGADTGAPKRVYAKASVLHEFLGDREETLYQDVAFRDKTDLAGTWYSVGLGTNISFAENFSFYADAERDFGTDLKVQYRIEGGLRFEF